MVSWGFRKCSGRPVNVAQSIFLPGWNAGIFRLCGGAAANRGHPAIAVDGRWLLQLYDRNYTRTEIMIRKPVRTPCCSPNLDDFKQ